ncbi:MAG: hypothetical protein Tp1123DCM1511741_44 [Prokaryotic dsDNA virus sp.]|nr:MAG: hypothetical protein Tp1123DCM1511741_44 [Prokaryotic dsDNA virus sp.]|tara:strand:+ start:8810 stop:9436 length:627 start_codon:yes stop_codon:yes gene_type:complete
MSAPSYPLTMPTSPTNFRQSEWKIISAVSMTQSPYSYSQQVADYGGSLWQTTVSLPPMNRATASEWQTFFMQLHGRYGTFLLSPPDERTIRGAEDSSPTVNGAHSVGAYDIVIQGAKVSSTVFKKGDYVQFGTGATSKLHMVVADITSNGAGGATLQIEPKLKTALADDATITFSSPKAVMRMDSNELGWTANQLSTYGISFSCTEAL